MCEFCNNIGELKLIKNRSFNGYYPDENIVQIVHNPVDNSYNIWSDGLGDPFSAEICIKDIKYCPICGRLLSD